METELKLKVPAVALEQLRNHPMLQARSYDAPVEHHPIDTYYDTQQRDLWKHGLRLRVRCNSAQTARSSGQTQDDALSATKPFRHFDFVITPLPAYR